MICRHDVATNQHLWGSGDARAPQMFLSETDDIYETTDSPNTKRTEILFKTKFRFS